MRLFYSHLIFFCGLCELILSADLVATFVQEENSLNPQSNQPLECHSVGGDYIALKKTTSLNYSNFKWALFVIDSPLVLSFIRFENSILSTLIFPIFFQWGVDIEKDKLEHTKNSTFLSYYVSTANLIQEKLVKNVAMTL